MHGLTRLPHLSAFADGMVKEFANTVLPAMVVRPFATWPRFRGDDRRPAGLAGTLARARR